MQKPRLLDQVRELCRVRHYSPRTEKTYIDWIKRYIYFHDKRHPKDMGAAEINAFLSCLTAAKGSRGCAVRWIHEMELESCPLLSL